MDLRLCHGAVLLLVLEVDRDGEGGVVLHGLALDQGIEYSHQVDVRQGLAAKRRAARHAQPLDECRCQGIVDEVKHSPL